MELIKVSTAKLKVILSAEDMGVYGITSDELGNAMPRARQMFRRILDKAKTQTGFETGDGRLYVRVFESADGGCELFVSKKVVMLPEPGDSSHTRAYRAPTRQITDAYIVTVTDFEDLAALCLRLHETHFAGCSALYYYDDAYRLYLHFLRRYPSFDETASEEDSCDTLNRFSFIGDYGQTVCADAAGVAILRERGEHIAENDAVKRIAEAIGKNA